MKDKKTLANIFQWKTTVTWPKNSHYFFELLGVICHFSINIRIEEHFFFALWNERTLMVACKSLRSASQKIYIWPVSFHFPTQTKLDVCVKHGCPGLQNMAKSTFWPRPSPRGHVMSFKCKQPLGELAVQVWLLTIQTLNIALCL